MSKGKYRAIDVKRLDVERLKEQVRDRRLVVGADMAKETHFAALLDEDKEVIVIFKWEQLKDNHRVVELLRSLPAASVEVAMEPSGTYGDPFRALAQQAALAVYRVSPKRCHDYAEVYDGVPSHHDSKSAVLLGRLQLEGFSTPWALARPDQRELTAAVRLMEIYQDQKLRHLGRLEAQLARHWPELTSLISLDTATLSELVGTYGAPAEVVSQGSSARDLMRRVGRLSGRRIDDILASANTTMGVAMEAGERRLMQAIAQEARRAQQAFQAAKKQVEKLCESNPVIRQLARSLGVATAAVLVTEVGDPRDFSSAAGYRKAYGLNLKVRSSGKYKGLLKITKRGPGAARQWLYLAVLRLLKSDAVMQAWYERKVARDGGVKMKALTALMRKLAGALWHVARGEAFDSRKLFDVRRLNLAG